MVAFHEGRNLPGNSHLIMCGNESHQQDTGGKKALHLSGQSRRRCDCSDGWDPKLASPQTQSRSFHLASSTKETRKPWVSELDHGQGCRLIDRLWSAWEGQRCHLSFLALQRPEDAIQLCHKDRKVISGRPLRNAFMCIHTQVQGLHAIQSIGNTSIVHKPG